MPFSGTKSPIAENSIRDFLGFVRQSPILPSNNSARLRFFEESSPFPRCDSKHIEEHFESPQRPRVQTFLKQSSQHGRFNRRPFPICVELIISPQNIVSTLNRFSHFSHQDGRWLRCYIGVSHAKLNELRRR